MTVAPSKPSLVFEVLRLFPRAGDEDLLAEEGTIVEPSQPVPQPDDLADNDEGGGSQMPGLTQDGIQGAGDDLLGRIGPPSDQGDGGGRTSSVGSELFHHMLQAPGSHEKNQGIGSTRNVVPVDQGWGLGRILLGCNKGDGVGVISMSQRDSCISGCCRAGGDSGDDLERDSRLSQNFRLLSATAEDEGVASFETRHRLPLLSARKKQGIDLRLRNVVATSFLAHVDFLGLRPDETQQFAIHQVVIDDAVGGFQTASAL